MVLVKFYCDVITEAFYLLHTLIDTFFSQLRAFLVEQEEEGRPVLVKRKLDGAVDGSSANQKIRKSDATVFNL